MCVSSLGSLTPVFCRSSMVTGSRLSASAYSNPVRVYIESRSAPLSGSFCSPGRIRVHRSSALIIYCYTGTGSHETRGSRYAIAGSRSTY